MGRRSTKSNVAASSRIPLTPSDSINSSLLKSGNDRVTRSRAKSTGYKSTEVGKENQSDAGSNGSQVSGHAHLDGLALVPYIPSQNGSSSKGSRSENIRSPDHWTKFPNLIGGAVDEVTRAIHNNELRERVSNTLVEVMNNKNTLLGAFRNYFGAKKTSALTARTYLTKARVLLTDLLGFNELTHGLEQRINEETTFQELLGFQHKADNNNNDMKQRNGTAMKASAGVDRGSTSGFSVQNAINSYKNLPNNERDVKNFKTPILKRQASELPKSSLRSPPTFKRHASSLPESSVPKQERLDIDVVPRANRKSVRFDIPDDNNQLNTIQLSLLISGSTAPVCVRRPFIGTAAQLKAEIKKTLEGKYTGNIDDMVEMLSEGIIKEHRYAKQLQNRGIPFDLLVATFNYCSRYIAFESAEVTDEEL